MLAAPGKQVVEVRQLSGGVKRITNQCDFLATKSFVLAIGGNGGAEYADYASIGAHS